MFASVAFAVYQPKSYLLFAFLHVASAEAAQFLLRLFQSPLRSLVVAADPCGLEPQSLSRSLCTTRWIQIFTDEVRAIEADNAG